MRIKYFIILFILLSILIGCEDLFKRDRTNPYDPLGTNYSGMFEYGQDQVQSNVSSIGGVPSWDALYYAQSFIPTRENLLMVKCFLYSKTGTNTFSCKISIRNSLTSNDLTSISTNITIDDYGEWISADFPDITVVAGDVYYIVIEETTNLVITKLGWRNGGDAYPNGRWWYYYDSVGGSWREPTNKYNDFAFATYYEMP